MPIVLVVDDDPEWRKLCSVVLGGFGIAIHQCAESSVALDLVETVKPDRVILDVNMTHLDGFQLLWHLTNGARTAHIPVIMMSTRAKAIDFAWAQRLGADRYIVKGRDLPAVVEDLKGLAAELLVDGPSEPILDSADTQATANGRTALQVN